MKSSIITNVFTRVRLLLNKESFKRLYRHTFNYGFGGILEKIVGFFLIPLYTIYLTPSDYGMLELAQTLTAFAVPFMKFGLPGSVTRFYFDYRDYPSKLSDYITTIRRLLNVLALVIGAVFIVFLFFFGENIFKGLPFWPFMVIAIATAGLGANNQLQAKLLQNREQSRYAVILRSIFILLSISSAVIFVVVLKMGALGLILSSLIIVVIFYFQASYYLKADTKGNFSWKMAKEGLVYGTGVLPHHLSQATAPMLSKTILVNFATLAALGHYSIAMRFFMPLELLYTSTVTAFTPIYNAYRKDGDSIKIRENVKQLLFVSLLAYAGMQLLAPLVMDFMLPSSFETAIPLIPVLSIAFIGKAIYAVNVSEIFYSKKTQYVSIITFGGLMVNLLICLLFAKEYTSTAISWAFSIGFLFSALLSYLYKKKVSQYEMFNREIGFFVIGSVIITIIAFLIYNC